MPGIAIFFDQKNAHKSDKKQPSTGGSRQLHTPSYLGGRDQEHRGSKSRQTVCETMRLSQKTHHKKGLVE
jgi:hypothetical protein